MAKAKVVERLEARRMRWAGASLREISLALDVSIGSASVWVRNIPRPQKRPSAPPVQLALVWEEEPTKVCGACKADLPVSSFNRDGDGYQAWCRECYREYFRKRGELHRRQVRAAARRRRAEAKTFILEFLASTSCADCGEADPVILEFDHVGEKRGHVSHLAAQGLSVKALRKEIGNCEVVCANCHRRRTARRGNWRRARSDWRTLAIPRLPAEARNVDHAYQALERSGCSDCGERDLTVLEFDHVKEKSASVLKLAKSGCGLARLQEEIARCEVRCANCHRKRTARALGHYRAA